jgi:hypothetical protein
MCGGEIVGGGPIYDIVNLKISLYQLNFVLNL